MPTAILSRLPRPTERRMVAGRLTVIGMGIFLCLTGCRGSSDPTTPQTQTQTKSTETLSAIRPKVVAFCGDCHAVPVPESFPADAWYSEVKRGFDFYYQSGRNDLSPPPLNEVVTYYRTLAPTRLVLQAPPASPGEPKLSFQKSVIQLPSESPFAAVSHLDWDSTAAEGAGRLTVCDMQSGDVRQFGFSGREPKPILSANAGHPAHVEPCDLDADGSTDWVVADLGSFQPADHQRGRVLWLRLNDKTQNWDATVLASGLGRVADVSAADFDSDGDLDLVVAEFGWQKTGRTLLLEQTDREERPTFQVRQLDPRHGGIHVPAVDLDGDGRSDFIALISQEHEVIEAFFNRGDGQFEQKRIYAADDPSFGSSGIQVVDLDGDGDLDVVYTNGDSLDGYHIKPYHAIHWLENQGTLPFQDHVLTGMPGVFSAVTGDMDGDGDLDIVACSFIPRAQIRALPADPLDSLIWLEQTSLGQFVRHRLEQSERGHVALEVGDFDVDGDLDLAVGNFTNTAGENADWVTLWWNRPRATAEP